MSRGMLQLVIDFTSLYFLLLVLVSFQFVGCDAAGDLHHACTPSSCGNIANISYPFRLKDDPPHCGKEMYELSCEDNVTIMYLYAGRYYVQEINYRNYTIRVVDSGLQPDNCSSLPSHSLSARNFSSGDPYSTYKYMPPQHFKWGVYLSKSVIFMSCEKPVSCSIYVDATSCLNGTLLDSDSSSYHYVMVGHDTVLEMEDSCRVEYMAMTSSSVGGTESDEKNMSYKHIHNQLTYGFELSWIRVLCRCNVRRSCHFDEDLQPQCFLFSLAMEVLLAFLIYLAFSTAMYLAARFILCGVPCFSILLVCKWRRRHLSAYDSVEDFLRSHNNLMPIRYAYSDIKRMTKCFEDKLGQGGFVLCTRLGFAVGVMLLLKYSALQEETGKTSSTKSVQSEESIMST